jgi:protein SMG8
VVGFISRRPEYSTRIINRVIDSNVFGSGNLDKPLSVAENENKNEELRSWFEWRSISYYLQEDKGILFLRFCSTRCPAMAGLSDPGSGFDDHESRDLQGLLFMFTVSARASFFNFCFRFLILGFFCLH